MTSAGGGPCLLCTVCNMVSVCLNFWPSWVGVVGVDVSQTIQGVALYGQSLSQPLRDTKRIVMYTFIVRSAAHFL